MNALPLLPLVVSGGTAPQGGSCQRPGSGVEPRFFSVSDFDLDRQVSVSPQQSGSQSDLCDLKASDERPEENNGAES